MPVFFHAYSFYRDLGNLSLILLLVEFMPILLFKANRDQTELPFVR